MGGAAAGAAAVALVAEEWLEALRLAAGAGGAGVTARITAASLARSRPSMGALISVRRLLSSPLEPPCPALCVSRSLFTTTS